MIIDIFPFFNEYDILEGRLEYLYDKVDRFVIVESNRTFTCKEKPLNLKNNIQRYSKYLDKIVHLVYQNNETVWSSSWLHYHNQLDYALNGITDISNESWVMVGDLDEIPNFDIVAPVINSRKSESYTFLQEMYFYNLKQRTVNPWSGTVLTTVGNLRARLPNHFRQVRTGLQFVNNGGWHLSYWGTPEKIRYKIENFSHQEFNDEKFKSIDAIKDKIANSVDIYARPEEQLVKVDRPNLHPTLVKYFSKYEVVI